VPNCQTCDVKRCDTCLKGYYLARILWTTKCIPSILVTDLTPVNDCDDPNCETCEVTPA
jgi:hypothetical protein